MLQHFGENGRLKIQAANIKRKAGIWTENISQTQTSLDGSTAPGEKNKWGVVKIWG